MAPARPKLWSSSWRRMREATGARSLPQPRIAGHRMIQPGEAFHLGHKRARGLGGADLWENFGPEHPAATSPGHLGFSGRHSGLGVPCRHPGEEDQTEVRQLYLPPSRLRSTSLPESGDKAQTGSCVSTNFCISPNKHNWGRQDTLSTVETWHDQLRRQAAT